MIIKSAEFNYVPDNLIKWACPDSPDGCCQYDDETDPAWEDCIHCHEPYKRS